MTFFDSTRHEKREPVAWRVVWLCALGIVAAFLCFLFVMMLFGTTDGWNPNSS